MYIHGLCYFCSSKVQFARQPLSLDSGSKAQEHNMDTRSSEYETLSVENGVLSATREEEGFSHVKMHDKNQDLLAEVLEKDKGTVRGGGAIEREVYVVVLW